MVFTCEKCQKNLATQQSLNYHKKTSKCGFNTTLKNNLSYNLGMCIVGEIIVSNSCKVLAIKKNVSGVNIGDDILKNIHDTSSVQFLKNMLELCNVDIIKDTFILNGEMHKYVLLKEESYRLIILGLDTKYFMYINRELKISATNISEIEGKDLKDVVNIHDLCNLISKDTSSVHILNVRYDCVSDRKDNGYYICCKNHVNN